MGVEEGYESVNVPRTIANPQSLQQNMYRNLQNNGLISTDRGAEATLTLTIPRSDI
jgi:DNA-binding IscR family transcriptional regulator